MFPDDALKVELRDVEEDDRAAAQLVKSGVVRVIEQEQGFDLCEP
jgi:hypothetical protein